jgi:hypothetical protein
MVGFSFHRRNTEGISSSVGTKPLKTAPKLNNKRGEALTSRALWHPLNTVFCALRVSIRRVIRIREKIKNDAKLVYQKSPKVGDSVSLMSRVRRRSLVPAFNHTDDLERPRSVDANASVVWDR